MLEDGFSPRRLGSAAIMLLATVILAVAVSLRGHYVLDEAFCMVFVMLAFFMVLIFEIEYERVHGLVGENTQSSLRRMAAGYSIGCAAAAGFAFLPGFYRPVILLSVWMSAFANARIAMTASLFWCVMLGLVDTGNSMELMSNVLMALISGSLCATFREEKYRFYTCVMLFFLPILVPSVFYYWNWKSISYSYYFFGGGVGFVTAVGAYFFYDLAAEETEYEVPGEYHRLVERDHPRVRELWKYSPMEYEHSRTVSNLACACAKELGLDSGLCEAAGFYYRMGRWVGEPYVENGVKRARQLCFPMPLQRILAEFGGEETPISSKESALVHMVDTLVLRGEVMEAQMGNSRWNRDMLVNQTLNELSAQGLYDQSCMSINEFLRVREFLTAAIHDDSTSSPVSLKEASAAVSEPIEKASAVVSEPIEKASAAVSEPIEEASAARLEPIEKTSAAVAGTTGKTSAVRSEPIEKASAAVAESTGKASAVRSEPIEKASAAESEPTGKASIPQSILGRQKIEDISAPKTPSIGGRTESKSSGNQEIVENYAPNPVSIGEAAGHQAASGNEKNAEGSSAPSSMSMDLDDELTRAILRERGTL